MKRRASSCGWRKRRARTPTCTVGGTSSEVTVEGGTIGQVETQSSDLSGVITGKEISQLQLNGRNFTQLATLDSRGQQPERPGRRHGRHQRQRGLQHQRRAHRVQQLGTRRRRQHGQRQQLVVECVSQHRRHR